MSVRELAGLERLLARPRARRRPIRPRPCACSAARRGGTQKVALPEGYLDHLDDDTPPEAEDADSGG